MGHELVNRANDGAAHVVTTSCMRDLVTFVAVLLRREDKVNCGSSLDFVIKGNVCYGDGVFLERKLRRPSGMLGHLTQYQCICLVGDRKRKQCRSSPRQPCARVLGER